MGITRTTKLIGQLRYKKQRPKLSTMRQGRGLSIKHIVSALSLASVIAVVALFAVGGSVVYAAGDTMYFKTDKTTYAVGDTMIVEVRENTNTDGVVATEGDFTYPADLLQFVSFDNNGAAFGGLTPNTPCPTQTAAAGTVTLAGCLAPIDSSTSTVTAVTGDALIAKVSFKVLAAGTATLKYTDAAAPYSSIDASALPVTKTDSNVTLGSGGGGGNPPPPPPPGGGGGNPTPPPSGPCSAPTADLGTDTLSVNIPSDGQYTVWTRMIAASASANDINLEIDGNNCFDVGGGSFAATTWADDSSNWVNYANGTASTPILADLTAGDHTFKYIGTADGVGVDKMIVTSDMGFAPTGVCDTTCLGSGGNSNPPTVNLLTPADGASVSGNVDLTATASDASGINKVDFLVDGQQVGTDDTSPYSYSWNSASVANGQHTITAQATNKNNISGTSTPITVTTNNGSSTCADNPSVPGNLTVSGTTASSVSLSWDASTPGANCTISGYTVYRDGTQVTTVTSGTTYNDTGLNPGGNYSYTIDAVDTSGHHSTQSAAVTGSTSSDSQPPSAPTNVHTTLTSANSIALAWDPSTDNNAVSGYVIYRAQGAVTSNITDVAGNSSTESFTDTNLTANTQYTYVVKAKDSAGLLSDASTPLTASTTDGGGGGGGGDGTMYVNPSSGSYGVGQQFTVEVRENSNSTAVNASEADMNYSSNNLQFVSIDGTGSDFGVDAQKTGGDGKIVIARGNTSPLTGDKLLAKVTFKVTGTGTGTVEMASTSVTLSSSTNGDVIANRKGASYTLTSTPGGGGNPTPTPPPSGGGGGTTIAPTGNNKPLPVTGGSSIELSDPAVLQTTDAAQNIKKVEYSLNGKLVATATQPPFSYTLDTRHIRNGTYKLTVKTYYKDGRIDSTDSSIVVKNPIDFTQVMLQLRHYAWLLLLVALIVGGGIWFMFFRRPGDGSSQFGDSDDTMTVTPSGTPDPYGRY